MTEPDRAGLAPAEVLRAAFGSHERFAESDRSPEEIVAGLGAAYPPAVWWRWSGRSISMDEAHTTDMVTRLRVSDRNRATEQVGDLVLTRQPDGSTHLRAFLGPSGPAELMHALLVVVVVVVAVGSVPTDQWLSLAISAGLAGGIGVLFVFSARMARDLAHDVTAAVGAPLVGSDDARRT